MCQQIYGAQFDAVRTGSIFETIFKIAVAADDVPVRIGASLLRWMVDRQHDQVAGIQAFISSLKVCRPTGETSHLLTHIVCVYVSFLRKCSESNLIH